MILRRLLLGLLLSTLLALYANENWMTRTVVIDASSHKLSQIAAVNDQEEGGHSVARVEQQGSGWVLHCDIKTGYEWPFCDLQIRLGMGTQGIDLTQFDSLRLWVRASGPEPRQQVRVFLRNFDPAYSSSKSVADLKPHEVVFDPAAEAQPVEFRLAQFMVASWWVQEHPLPTPLLGPQLGRVTLLSLTTGGQVVPGEHKIYLDRAEFVGLWVQPATFRLGVIAVWVLSMGLFLLWDWRRSRLRLSRTLRRKRELQKANARLVMRSDEYEAKAHHDGLTGLSNRTGLQHDLKLLIRAQEELLFPLAIVFVDIDHFKRINDTLGHDAGDEVLKFFAFNLKANIQREDLLARWGGEEFVLMMPQTTETEAVAVAERLRQHLTGLAWPAGLQVTSSFGVAQADSEATIEAAVSAADQAMYRAKRLGRNRVEHGASAQDAETT
ncbi:GGDEF domain-containing protein [Paucibacter sp. TC2R-5]|uniref:GGDEF domain-containing protein n=1 Tax=Paucibacter sp. TC2R-5 TaxID=2893555 RepID=UPI0021E49ECD|nr:GGDEF domain-containing protein [Paucibacter sp. TC2R-5]MCV2361523.1 GGDEF domain-containing protein [Paucibacter sp. TC2R-5]